MTKSLFRVLGANKTQKALAKKSSEYQRGLKRGVTKASFYLLRESLKLTPVDTGNLKRSGQVRVEGSGFNVEGKVVFTAEYSLVVHEMVGANFKAPGTQAKFLEQPARTERPKLKQIIRDELRS